MEIMLADPSEFGVTILLFLQIIILTLVLARSVRLVEADVRQIHLVLLAFGVGCFLVSDIYWLAHALLMPGIRLPFSVSEFGDNGVFLFYGMLLSSAVPGRCEKKAVYVYAALFAAANAALWIGWSGEWVKDIVGGLAFGWFLCMAARALWVSGALSRGEWRFLGFYVLLLITVQTSIFFVPTELKRPLDVFAYVLLFFGILLWCIKTFRARREGGSRRFLSLVFGGVGWICCTMYMSTGWMYFFADLCATLMLPVELLAVRRVVAES